MTSTGGVRVLNDPFDTIPDADPASIEVRQRAFQRPEKTCELLGKTSKPKKVDLNQRQRRWFEREGYVYHRVETQNAWGGMTSDLWGFGDYLAAHAERQEVLLVQVTTAAHAANRIAKAQKAPELAVWIAAGGRFQVHAWKQPGGPGTRWEMQVREVRALDGRASP
jgi:hypothetical protein